MELEKKYVPVTVHFDANGKMRPIEIEFDGNTQISYRQDTGRAPRSLPKCRRRGREIYLPHTGQGELSLV